VIGFRAFREETTVSQRLSRRVRELPASATMALSALANELKAAGKPVISFSVGEPDFTSPAVAGRAANAAIEAGDTRYPPVPGTKALIAAIRHRLKRDYAWEDPQASVLVSNGGKHSLYNLIQTLVDPGDEVVFPSPYWVSYPAMVQLAGGRAVPVETRAEEGFRLDPAAIESALGPRTKALVLNTPCNPTGAVADPADFEAVCKLAFDRGIFVISDEIYSGLVFSGAEHRSLFQLEHPRLKELGILCDGASKTYAMTGWRVGYAVGPQDVIKAASKIQGQSTSGVCTIAQAAAAAVLVEGQDAAAEMHAKFATRRELIMGLLREIPGVTVPEAKGAFYAFPDVSAYYGSTIEGTTVEGSADLSQLLLSQAHVAMVPGTAFGADAHLRISYALAEESIREGIGRMKDLLAKAEPQPA
jgi:aspartate aminotransferase